MVHNNENGYCTCSTPFRVPLFFGAERPGLALAVIMLALGTVIAVLILFGWAHVWLAFGLYAPYTVWLLVALGLNARFIAAQE